MRVLVVALLMPQLVMAAPCDRVALLEEGQQSPCTGYLWPETASREAGQLKATLVPKLKAEYARDKKIWAAALTKCQSDLKAARDHAETGEAVAGAALSPAPPEPAFWDRPAPWAVGGSIVGVLVGAATIALYEKVR
jgi:hypothetical protein